jgi:hypothetical protein
MTLIVSRSRTGSSMHADEPRRRSNGSVRPTVVNPSSTNGWLFCYGRRDRHRPLRTCLVARTTLMLKHINFSRPAISFFSVFDVVYGQRPFLSLRRFSCQFRHYGLFSHVLLPTVSVHIALLMGRYALRGWMQNGVLFFHVMGVTFVQNNTLGHTLGPSRAS